MYVCTEITYSLIPTGESEVDGNVGEFESKTQAIDCKYKNCVWMDRRQAIGHPHCTIQYGCDVWIWLEILY